MSTLRAFKAKLGEVTRFWMLVILLLLLGYGRKKEDSTAEDPFLDPNFASKTGSRQSATNGRQANVRDQGSTFFTPRSNNFGHTTSSGRRDGASSPFGDFFNPAMMSGNEAVLIVTVVGDAVDEAEMQRYIAAVMAQLRSAGWTVNSPKSTRYPWGFPGGFDSSINND